MKKIVTVLLTVMIVLSFGAMMASAEETPCKIEISSPYAICVDGDFLTQELILTVVDNGNEEGKDWIGIYPAEKNGELLEIDEISMSDTFGWWKYIGEERTFRLCAENFKLDWCKNEFVIGEIYYAILFDNDGYEVLDFCEFEVVDSEPTPTPEATATPVPTAEPTAAPTAEPTEAPENTGCGSAIGGGMIVALLFATIAIKKSKEN